MFTCPDCGLSDLPEDSRSCDPQAPPDLTAEKITEAVEAIPRAPRALRWVVGAVVFAGAVRLSRLAIEIVNP